MTLREQAKALRDNIALVDMELQKNRTLSTVWSSIDREALPKLDKARNDLTFVLVDLEQSLADVLKAESDLVNEFNRKM